MGKIPSMVNFGSRVVVVSVASGSRHTLALSSTGGVLGIGALKFTPPLRCCYSLRLMVTIFYLPCDVTVHANTNRSGVQLGMGCARTIGTR